jgi:hypothetical protein
MITSKKSVYTIGETFVYGNVLVALCGLALSLSTYIILNLEYSEISIPALALIFFSCLFIYNLNVFFLGEFDLNVERERWKSENIKLVKILCLFCLLPISFYGSLLSRESVFLLAHLFLLALLYIIPIKIKSKYYSFRKIPLLKIFILTYVWSCATVLLPVFECGFYEWNKISFLFMERFIFILAVSMPFDIRDYERDKEQAVLTIPGLVGKKNAVIISIFILSAFIFSSLIYNGWSYIFLSRTLIGLLAGYFIVNASNTRKEFYFLLYMDGILLLYFLILLASRAVF